MTREQPEDPDVQGSGAEDPRIKDPNIRASKDTPPAEAPEDDQAPLQEFSLEDLGAAYAQAMVESGMLPAESEAPDDSASATDEPQQLDANESAAEPEQDAVDPVAITEAALFVGHPENQPLTAAQIAATMRGVSADEVVEMIQTLNDQYEQSGHVFHVHERDHGGYTLGLAERFRPIRNVFYGKVRETRLNQAAIDVLALVAYQPGINASQITEQRGKDASSVVSLLVRRELLELRRDDPADRKSKACYYPTTRLLNLLGIGSLEDLPMVDETDVAPRG